MRLLKVLSILLLMLSKTSSEDRGTMSVPQEQAAPAWTAGGPPASRPRGPTLAPAPSSAPAPWRTRGAPPSS